MALNSTCKLFVAIIEVIQQRMKLIITVSSPTDYFARIIDESVGDVRWQVSELDVVILFKRRIQVNDGDVVCYGSVRCVHELFVLVPAHMQLHQVKTKQ
jgi:hypothetical protein